MTKKPTIHDPYAEREARKYANPIPSREVILDLLDHSDGPLPREVIAEKLGIYDEESQEALRRRLIAMVRDGQIVGNRKERFGRVDRMNLVRGRVQGHRDGYGWVLTGDGSEDIYLPNRQMRRVFDGDEVLVRLGERGFRGRKEGSIVEILARNTHQLVGRYRVERGVHYVRPDNPRIVQDIIIPSDQTKNARPGQLVVADIIEYPERDNLAIASIVEVLGDHLAPGMEIDVAIRSHGIPHIWPAEVERLAAALPSEVTESDKQGRFDLRDLPLVTIDGEDARDFDDAVYCEPKKSGGWRLFVAIADVSHYVQVGDALDKEAALRGNSVYFPDYVVPMLPEALSNGLCSLNPHVDRLCMVCEMTISAKGRITGYQFYEAVMHSHARLTYTQVGQVLAERGKVRSGVRQQFHHVVKQLDDLHDLYQVLREAREQRGAIDFETVETRIIFDENRKIKKIVPVQRNDAHKLIEECMLAANVCSAKFLEQHKVPALYRVHEGPKEQKLELLREYLAGLGLGLRDRVQVTPRDYQEVLQAIEGRPDAHLIQTTMLRSMNQAVYQPENRGHFGLAYDAYTHFTSPIRRYPDLLVHRAIRSIIRSEKESKKVRRHPEAKLLPLVQIYPYSVDDMQVLGEQSSITERRADEATRDVVSWLKCEYLQDRVGEVFDGVVSSVVSFGLFVELKDLYIEGLVHITNLPSDYYVHEPARGRLIGERTRKVFALGDELRVQVVNVNLDERKIDFEIVEIKPGKKKKIFVSETAKALAQEYQEKTARKVRKRPKEEKVLGKAPAPSKSAKVEKASKADAGKAKGKPGAAKGSAGKVKADKAKTGKAQAGKTKVAVKAKAGVKKPTAPKSRSVKKSRASRR
ncbi:ribonuclease R [Saccharophagus sp. K07]|uniref:ribonuclease R n=1 Tax=Saccharophagus sp. K07 TaxID=2283636 RepID=UPI00165203D6|nr:ribonuclease R [Saccharophagus sp. K07]MBC6903941.1 ribonuclease R [Saccharophagus sp. K07]